MIGITFYFFHNNCVYIHCMPFSNYKKCVILPPGSAFEKIFRNFKISNVKIISRKQRISQGKIRIY